MPHVSSLYKRIAVMPLDELFAELGADGKGLAAAEAAKRQRRFGANDASVRRVTLLGLLLRQLRSPFILILAIAAGLSLWSGNHVDAALVAGFVTLNVVLGFLEEYRAERAARLLMRYWRNTARVRRDGAVVTENAEALVPGDVVCLRAGDRVPGDMRILSASGFAVDESMLTGEAGSTDKAAQPMAAEPGAYHEAGNVAFAGTMVTTGEADAIVFATGAASTLGDIVALTGGASITGRLEREMRRFSAFILKLVAVTLITVLALNLVFKPQADMGELVLFIIALVIGVVPEALPVVLAVAHSRAAMRMSRRGVIVKRLAAVDDLGSLDVLCIDKTGTVTDNRLRLVDVQSAQRARCLWAALVSGADLGSASREAANAFDLAVWNATDEAGRAAAAAVRRLLVLPFDPQRRRSSSLVRDEAGQSLLVTRGAPEEILPLCTDLDEQRRAELLASVADAGAAGRRVLAVASRAMAASAEAVCPTDETDLAFLGLLSFDDPLKPDAAAAMHRARALGVKVKMLTGDGPEVAFAVARSLGLATDASSVMTGAAFEVLPPAAQRIAVVETAVFARVSPQQKFRIVELLSEAGEAVGFLGEGFNDAPSLKLSSVGIAVENASDIAKEVADVIITDKSLSAIIDGIAAGRRNFANIVKYLKVTLASNFGNFYSVAIASLLVPFLPMLPVQILLLNLLTDAPMVAIVTDSVASDELRRPSHYDARTVIIAATVLGVVSSAFDFLTFGVFFRSGAATLQTMWFIVSALTELVLIMSVRTAGPFHRGARLPPGLVALIVAVIAVAVALPFTGVGQEYFGFVRPRWVDLGVALAIVLAYFLTTEAVKRAFLSGLLAGRGGQAASLPRRP
jgi:Mg2+-importing ATPase